MKKFFLGVFLSIILIGCSLANTPTSKVEEYLGNYQRLDNNININYYDLSIDKDIAESTQEEYTKLIKDQYQNLSYEIKEEIIDGQTATVTVSIEVTDYKEILNKYNKNEYSKEDYHELVINDLKNTKTKVNYTTDFTLTKDNNDKWSIDDITKTQKEKLLGIN